MTAGLSLTAARFLSSAVNPLFAAVWIAAAWIAWRRRRAGLGRYAVSSGVALLVTYLVVHTFRWSHLWPSHPEFPSGHETFGASIGTSLALWNPKWLIAAIPLLLVLGISLVRAHYHDWLDIAGAVVVSTILTWICHLLIRKQPSGRAA